MKVILLSVAFLLVLPCAPRSSTADVWETNPITGKRQKWSPLAPLTPWEIEANRRWEAGRADRQAREAKRLADQEAKFEAEHQAADHPEGQKVRTWTVEPRRPATAGQAKRKAKAKNPPPVALKLRGRLEAVSDAWAWIEPIEGEAVSNAWVWVEPVRGNIIPVPRGKLSPQDQRHLRHVVDEHRKAVEFAEADKP